MANKKASLVWYCKTDSGWKRLPVVVGRNGKLRLGYAVFDGEPTHFPDGHYEIRAYEGKKTVYKNVGSDPADALAALNRQTHLLQAKDSAKAAGIEITEPDSKRLDLLKKRDEFIERHKAKGHVRSSEVDLIAIDNFLDATKHTHSDQITEDSILVFYRELRRLGNGDRTIFNKGMTIFSWFKWMKVDAKAIIGKVPGYTKREVEEYNPEDLKALFSACTTEYQRVVFETLLKTGVRKQEGMNLEWSKVDFRAKKIKVREILDSDTDDNVTIKDRAERSIPLSDDLAETLKAWKEKHPKTRLVLGTVNDTPNGKWLKMLKRTARRAGLNCNHCSGCRGETRLCSRWKLKTFRSTYTTTMLRNGIDPRTLMEWTGHEDLATVLKYLAPSKDPKLQAKVSQIEWI